VTVQFSRTARELRLLKGQARFDVVGDVERPFSVTAGNQKVIALGTAFNIDLTQHDIAAVTLIEGRVVVLDMKQQAEANRQQRLTMQKAREVELQPGQQIISGANRTPTVRPANVQQVTAWVSGQLVFSNETLSEVIARVNHYSAVPIVIEDPKIANVRVTGVFNTGDVSGSLEIIRKMLALQISDEQSGHILLKGGRKN